MASEPDKFSSKQQLSQERVQYDVIFESIGDGMAVMDIDENVTMVNRQAELLLDYKKADVLGKKWSSVVPLVDGEGNKIPVSRRPSLIALQHRTRVTTTAYQYTRSDGSFFPVHITASPVIVGEKLTGAVVIFQDITKQKEIDKAKTEFVSLASHQLRTPLSAIAWHTELLKKKIKDRLNPEELKYLDEIYQSNRHMINLVNALLNVSRIELGKLGINPQLIDLTTIVKSLLEELTPQIQEKHLTVKENYQQPLPKINVDEGLMRIILQNLLSNAIKYSYHNAIVEVKIQPDQKEKGESIIISVSDEGIGIPAEQKQQIFNKLFRADNAVNEAPDGNGLGLYITKAIVEESGGSIWFESEEKRGTTFYVRFPTKGMKPRAGAKSLLDMRRVNRYNKDTEMP